MRLEIEAMRTQDAFILFTAGTHTVRHVGKAGVKEKHDGRICRNGWLLPMSTNNEPILALYPISVNSATISLSDQGILFPPATAIDVSEPLPVMTTTSPYSAIDVAVFIPSFLSSISFVICDFSFEIPALTSDKIWRGSSS